MVWPILRSRRDGGRAWGYCHRSGGQRRSKFGRPDFQQRQRRELAIFAAKQLGGNHSRGWCVSERKFHGTLTFGFLKLWFTSGHAGMGGKHRHHRLWGSLLGRWRE